MSSKAEDLKDLYLILRKNKTKHTKISKAPKPKRKKGIGSLYSKKEFKSS